MREPGPATACARHEAEPPSTSTPLAAPITLSAVYAIEDLDHLERIYGGAEPGFTYARDGHPGSARLEVKVAKLEGAERALACGSGMAAESAVMLGLLGQGAKVALAEGIYGRTDKLLGQELARFGVEVATFDAADLATAGKALEGARLAFVETISNPLLRVADLPGLLAMCRERGVLVAVDHTFAPLLCRPLEWGADLVIHSATKFLAGHSDVTLGVVAGRAELIDRLRASASTYGLTANAFDCWLVERGLSTLALRCGRAGANAAKLADALAGSPGVRAIHYPGRPGHPDHARAARLLTGGFGAMIALDVGDRERANRLIRALGRRGIPFAPSLGDVRTTVSYPAGTSHRGQSAEHWQRQGITPGLLRVSVGIEEPEDLVRDFGASLTESESESESAVPG